MHNQVILIGRLVSEPELKTLEDERQTLTMTLCVSRGFKNEDGIYDVDYIRVCLWNCLASNTAEYCHKGDLVCVRGRIQTGSYEKEGEKKYYTDVIVDRVSFLASARREDER